MTYIPYLSSAGELKTKPTQHSVKELLNAGIQPDIIMCRSERIIDRDSIAKISLFCNVKKDSVIPALNAQSIYEVPLLYSKFGLDKILLKHLNYKQNKYPLNLKPWNKLIKKINSQKNIITVGVVGKYTNLKDSYKSLNEALIHGGIENSTRVNINWINAEKLNKNNLKLHLSKCNGILVPGGFGLRGIGGKIEAIRFARENNIPYFGICLGMQLAVIEIARNVLNLKNANSSEFNSSSKSVVGLMTEWTKGKKIEKRNLNSDKGGTMRLGSYKAILKKNSKIISIYKKNVIFERHRHRYEVNSKFISKFNNKGYVFSGMSPDGVLPEVLESKLHPWFIGVQYHPELKSRPLSPHPLFVSFIKNCIK